MSVQPINSGSNLKNLKNMFSKILIFIWIFCYSSLGICSMQTYLYHLIDIIRKFNHIHKKRKCHFDWIDNSCFNGFYSLECVSIRGRWGYETYYPLEKFKTSFSFFLSNLTPVFILLQSLVNYLLNGVKNIWILKNLNPLTL